MLNYLTWVVVLAGRLYNFPNWQSMFSISLYAFTTSFTGVGGSISIWQLLFSNKYAYENLVPCSVRQAWDLSASPSLWHNAGRASKMVNRACLAKEEEGWREIIWSAVWLPAKDSSLPPCLSHQRKGRKRKRDNFCAFSLHFLYYWSVHFQKIDRYEQSWHKAFWHIRRCAKCCPHIWWCVSLSSVLA